MKKNGFIATSVLYTFFLIFLSLFAALMANYMHNKLLIEKINNESREKIIRMNNFRLTDIKLGDRIRFDSNNTLIDKDSIWTLSKIENISESDVTLYFLSDLKVQKKEVYTPTSYDPKPDFRNFNIDLYNELQSSGRYKNAIRYPGFDITIPSSSFLKSIRDDANISDDVKDTIFNIGEEYVVMSDSDLGYNNGSYYTLRKYNFDQKSSSDLIARYCGVTINGDNSVNYGDGSLSYVNTLKKTALYDKYINYCYYARPFNEYYTVKKSEGVVDTDLTRKDLVEYNWSSDLSIRLLAKITLNKNSESYISGGKGSMTDPYQFTNGVRIS